MSFFIEAKNAASLFIHKQGLGVPIHTKKLSILINMYYDTLLVIVTNYIALPVDPFWTQQQKTCKCTTRQLRIWLNGKIAIVRIGPSSVAPCETNRG